MKTAHRFLTAFILAAAVAAPAPPVPAFAAPAKAGEAAIALEAYIYLYPLVIMDVTRRVFTNVEADKVPGFGPMNSFHHMRSFPGAEMRTVVRPNFDALYSVAWLDLSAEPMIVTAPDTGGRYYELEMLDMWSDVFAVPGKRTTGTAAGAWAVVPQGWSGDLPWGVGRIESPTRCVWVVGRTQTDGPADYEAVNRIQDGYQVTPLSRWGKAPRPPTFRPDPSVDMKTPPVAQVNGMSGKAFFTYAAELMKDSRPHLTDWSMIARMKRIGIDPGKSLQYDKLDAAVREALDAVPLLGQEVMRMKMPGLGRMVNGWTIFSEGMGVYGNNYLRRAVVAMMGLSANQPEDAIYPQNVSDADGKPCNGDFNYVLHFSREEMPPVEAFWSLAMYDASGFQAANPLNRFSIGSRDPLKYNSDGSLDIWIQNANPGLFRESNWLPAPRGPLGMTMRLYWPKPQALDGRWNPPPVKRMN